MAVFTRLLPSIQHSFLVSTMNNIILPSRPFKTALKIKWVKPEKIPCIKPEQSGDLEPLGTLDMTQFPSSYKVSKELQSADEIIQRLHTLEFFPRQTLKEEFCKIYEDKVKAHQFDDDSIEVKLARLTVSIRNLQIHMEKFPFDRVNKNRLKMSIDKRNKMLTQLRNRDYKKFEWILEKLNLVHKVFGMYNMSERVERKKSMRRLTMLYVIKIKTERLAEYKNLLESQKEQFLEEKLEKLNWIKAVEEKYAMTPTVSDDDINAVRIQLEPYQSMKLIDHCNISQ